LKTMCGILPFFHWYLSRVSISRAARLASRWASPMATKAESQLHWCG
jgi:hypothetical protein